MILVVCDLVKFFWWVISCKNEDGMFNLLKIVVLLYYLFFFNVMCNEIGRVKEGELKVRYKWYFFYCFNSDNCYIFWVIEDILYFYYVVIFLEL